MRKAVQIISMIVAALLSTMLLFALAGCGSQSSASDDNSSRRSSSSSEAARASDDDASMWSGEGSASSRADAADESAVETVTSEYVRVSMPESIAQKGATWSVYSEQMVLEVARNGERAYVATIDWSERSASPYDMKEYRWRLGETTYQGQARDVVLHVPFVDGKGAVISANSSVQSTASACRYHLDIGEEAIISWIVVLSGNGDSASSASSAAGSNAAGSSAVGSSVTGVSSCTTPFWGVWIYASTSLNDAVTVANEAIADGFAAEVFLSTDWANLNSQPYYVVSLGRCSSESAASALVDKAHNAGYSDAYAKHTGDRK